MPDTDYTYPTPEQEREVIEQTPFEILEDDDGLPQPPQDPNIIIVSDGEALHKPELRVLALARGASSVEATLNLARSQIGTVESPPNSNNVKYGREYGMNREPWCAMFVTWVLKNSGNTSGYRFASVAHSLDWARKTGRHTGDFQPGYVACRLNGSGWWGPGHTGLIEAVHSDGSVTCIEGNTSPGAGGSQRDGGGCWRRRRPKGYWNRQCIRINYGSGSTPGPTPEPDPIFKELSMPQVVSSAIIPPDGKPHPFAVGEVETEGWGRCEVSLEADLMGLPAKKARVAVGSSVTNFHVVEVPLKSGRQHVMWVPKGNDKAGSIVNNGPVECVVVVVHHPPA